MRSSFYLHVFLPFLLFFTLLDRAEFLPVFFLLKDLTFLISASQVSW